MFADLHLHSIYSDGRYTPEEICRKAVSRGLSLLSVTDHDTLLGEEVKRKSAEKYGLLYLSGWEISAYLDGVKLHILGYGCTIGERYRRFISLRERTAYLRAEDSLSKLQKIGIEVTMDEVNAQKKEKSAPVHTMHVTRAAAKVLGISDSQAYEEYFNVGKIAHSSIGRPTPKEAIDCIHECGGVAVVAHPGRIELPDAERELTVLRMIKEGADGIEVFYTTHTEREREYFSRLAKENGLLVTGGSDTHFEDGTHAIGSPEFQPSKELLERVRLL